MPKRIEYQLSVDYTQYTRAMKAAINMASQLDEAMKALAQQIRKLEGVAIKLMVDTSAIDRAKSEINAIDGRTPNVEVQVDDTQIENAQNDVEVIDGQTPNVDVRADASELEDAETKVSALDGQTPNVEVKVDSTSIDRARQEVRAAFLGIPLVFDVGNIPSLLGGLGELPSKLPIVGSMIDAAEAAKQFESGLLASGKSIEDYAGYGDIFQQVIASGLASSQEELVKVALAAVDAKTPLDQLQTVIQTTLGASRITGRSAEESFTQLNTLVRNDLAASWQEAGDVVVAAGSRLDDYIDGAEEFGAKMSAAGFDAATSLAVFNAGLDAGLQNSGRLGEVFNEFPNYINEALGALQTGGTTPLLDALGTLGMENDQAALQAASDDTLAFVDEVVNQVNSKIASGEITPIEGNQLIAAVFGSPVEEVGAEVFRNIDFSSALEQQFEGGNLERALAPLQDTFRASIGRLKNIIIQELGEGFSIAGRSLTSILDEVPNKINEIADLVEQGMGLPEALEIALEAPGLAESIRQLQATIGGFVVDLQIALAAALDVLGKTEAAAGLRTSAAAGAQTQLAFDIQYLDPDKVSSSIALALRRGVDESGINEAITEAGENLVGEGRFKDFQNILDQLGNTAFLPTTFSAMLGAQGSSLSDLYEVDPTALETTKTLITDIAAATSSWIAPTQVTFGDVISFDVGQLAADAGLLNQNLSAINFDALGEGLNNYSGSAKAGLSLFGESTDATRSDLIGLESDSNRFADGAANAIDSFATRGAASLKVIDAAMMMTKQLMFDAGVDPTRFAALVFGSSVDAMQGTEGRATGGNVQAGQMYKVGEAGWEYFIPQTNGYIMPHNESMAMGSMPSFTGNTNVSTVYNNMTLNSTMNNPSYAASVGAAQVLANQTRGFF